MSRKMIPTADATVMIRAMMREIVNASERLCVVGSGCAGDFMLVLFISLVLSGSILILCDTAGSILPRGNISSQSEIHWIIPSRILCGGKFLVLSYSSDKNRCSVFPKKHSTSETKFHSLWFRNEGIKESYHIFL